MIKTKELENGKIEVTSDKGLVDIGEGPVKKIVCSPGEVEFVEEVKKKKAGK